MAHIPYPDPASQSPEIVDRLARMGSLNVNRLMSHNPDLMVAYSRMGAHLLRKGLLDPVLREVVILRIGQLCKSDYEWHQHASVARAVGMSEEMLGAIERGDHAALGEREQAAIAFAEEIHAHNAASPETFARLQKQLGVPEMIELALVAGFYIMTAGYLRSFGIEIEDTPPLGAAMTAQA